jgi:hypothetical protein
MEKKYLLSNWDSVKRFHDELIFLRPIILIWQTTTDHGNAGLKALLQIFSFSDHRTVHLPVPALFHLPS